MRRFYIIKSSNICVCVYFHSTQQKLAVCISLIWNVRKSKCQTDWINPKSNARQVQIVRLCCNMIEKNGKLIWIFVRRAVDLKDVPSIPDLVVRQCHHAHKWRFDVLRLLKARPQHDCHPKFSLNARLYCLDYRLSLNLLIHRVHWWM